MSYPRIFTLVGFLILGFLLSAFESELVAGPFPVPLLAPGAKESLAGTLRGHLLNALPDPLYETKPNWGHQKKAKNQGTWRKTLVTPINPTESLKLVIREIQSPEPGRLTFSISLEMDSRAEHQRQTWEAGLKVFDATVRARFRIKARLECEAVTRIETNAFLLPDAVFRLRVTKSDLQLENIVVEHIAGLGGDAAKLLGDATIKSIHKIHPALEKRLLDKANAAIVKAGDTKEVHVSLLQIWKKENGKVKKD
jgi:hypothetical protein